MKWACSEWYISLFPIFLLNTIDGACDETGWWLPAWRLPRHQQNKTAESHCDHWLSLQWRHNGHDSISNLQPHDCLLNYLFRRRSKQISKLRVTGLCVGNSPVTGEFPAQMASNVENFLFDDFNMVYWSIKVRFLTEYLISNFNIIISCLFVKFHIFHADWMKHYHDVLINFLVQCCK